MKEKISKMLSLLTATALAVGTLTLSACGRDPVVEDSNSSAASDTASSTSKDDTFTYAIAGDPGETVNVITTSDRYGLSTIKMIYSPLYMNNADGINWFLATDYSVSDDNLTYTFNLRDDVTWSDGEPFTADDVVFTYEEMEKEENVGWAYSQLVYNEGTVKVTKVDDYTVSFTFPFQTPTAVEMLSQIFIMPEHIYKDVTDYEHNDYNMNSVGTGPYKLVDYQAGSYLRFEANESYFKGTPSIKNIVFRIIENSDTAILALQSGEIDAYSATPSEVEKLDMDQNNLTAYTYTEGRVGYMMINCNRVPDQKVRQAIFYALDKKAMNDAAFLSDEYYLTPNTFLPTNSQFYDDSNVEDRSPVFAGATFNTGNAVVKFGAFSGKLVGKGEPRGFELKIDGKWIPAKAEIDSDSTVVVSAPNSHSIPEGVRYLWKSWAKPDAWLYTDGGLPAFGFEKENK